MVLVTVISSSPFVIYHLTYQMVYSMGPARDQAGGSGQKAKGLRAATS